MTAGNASQISDGAAAVMVTTPEHARELGLTPIVRLHSGVAVGADPVSVLTGSDPGYRETARAQRRGARGHRRL